MSGTTTPMVRGGLHLQAAGNLVGSVSHLLNRTVDQFSGIGVDIALIVDNARNSGD